MKIFTILYLELLNLDLHGGRSYLLPEEELAPMCFEYLIGKGFTAERFSKLIYNTNELNELIEDLFEVNRILEI